MQHARRIATWAAAISAGATTLLAEPQPWAQSGNWEILVDPDLGNGCFMQRDFDNGITLQFGAQPAQASGFVAAYNPAWTFIEDGQTGIVRFEFPDVIFEGEVTGELRDGIPGGRAIFDNPNLPFEFAKRRSMTIVGKRIGRIEINLDGSLAAIRQVRVCQDQQAPPG